MPLVETVTDDDQPQPVPIEGTLAGRSFSDISQHTASLGSGEALWTPVLDGTDRLGVLHVMFRAECDLDEDLLRISADVAALLAEVVTTRTMYGDGVERARRRVPMTLPAELQWRLLPPLTFVSPRVAVAGILAPTHEVAGDSFDYALNDRVLHVAIVDGMGLRMLEGGVELGAERLEPGDRLVLYTDGVVEARNAEGVFFGPERLVELVIRQDSARRPAAETLRRLDHAILAHQDGELQDDATTVLVEWLTDQPDRSTPARSEGRPRERAG